MEIVDLDNSDYLLRRIHPDHYTEEENGAWRPTSAAFTDSEMSVDIEKLREFPEDCLIGTLSTGLVKFSVGLAEEQQQEVKHTPRKENYSHGDVIGIKTKKIRRKFAKSCEWVIYNPPLK